MNGTPIPATRILVVGAGALGTTTAVRLAMAEHSVVVAVRSVESAGLLRAKSLKAEAPDGSTQAARIPVISNPAELSAPVDVLIITTKCAVALSVAAEWIGSLKDGGVFVPYQNGLLGDAMAGIAGARLVECAVYYGATLLGPGHSHRDSLLHRGTPQSFPWCTRSRPTRLDPGSNAWRN